MTDDETVGKYLARARTLLKTKLRTTTQWDMEYNESNAFYVYKGLKPQKLKNKTLNKISLHKSYKECFNSIEEM